MYTRKTASNLNLCAVESGSKKATKNKWLKILKLLADMPEEERKRCILATAAFYGV